MDQGVEKLSSLNWWCSTRAGQQLRKSGRLPCSDCPSPLSTFHFGAYAATVSSVGLSPVLPGAHV